MRAEIRRYKDGVLVRIKGDWKKGVCSSPSHHHLHSLCSAYLDFLVNRMKAFLHPLASLLRTAVLLLQGFWLTGRLYPAPHQILILYDHRPHIS
ncbi:MAG: hypothetical protein FRX48_03655 [Lasallia pustulata]|uniref:Uncharacterized protein n=1 Tax=Lasallia pustulata TaxID=136370 RepID=A0A5M8PVF4_9LECA|nr:MAG: hypothetical protein FRX48_03655 [Lasallia pustulata]